MEGDYSMTKKKERIRVYGCYSFKLKEFLEAKGAFNLCCAKDSKTKRLFWMFVRDEVLESALDEWDSIHNRNNKKKSL